MLFTGEVYHIYSKSIAGFKIFNNDSDYSRMTELMHFYQYEEQKISFSRFKERAIDNPRISNNKLVQIICHSPMPTHIHLTVKQLIDKGISTFMRRVLDSYSRYFNIRHNRKGPLWEGRFKKVLVKTDAQLLHLTRYIHLNPVTAGLVDKPEKWRYSSYSEYIYPDICKDRICNYADILNIDPCQYKKFVEDRIAYQRELAKIKHLMFD